MLVKGRFRYFRYPRAPLLSLRRPLGLGGVSGSRLRVTFCVEDKIRSNGSSEGGERLELDRVLFEFDPRDGVEDA